MKKTYCDVCGTKCDHIEDKNAIELDYEIVDDEGNEDIETLLLPDICWPCRNEIAESITKRMKDAEMKHAKAMARRQRPDTPP